MRRFFSLTMLLLAVGLGIQAQQATVRIDAQTKHQRITGFGGFVCSPQFTYNHMSTAEIKKVWGKSSTVGCNIMRDLPVCRRPQPLLPSVSMHSLLLQPSSFPSTSQPRALLPSAQPRASASLSITSWDRRSVSHNTACSSVTDVNI